MKIDHIVTACSETPPAVLFHGTTADFDSFDDGKLSIASGHVAARLGHFFSTCPRIASTFALDEHVLDRGYDVVAGSKVLLNPAWIINQSAKGSGGPYRTGATVRLATVSVARPSRISAADFAIIVDDEAFDWNAFRAGMIEEGYDALLIEGDPEANDRVELSVEYAADTWVIFSGRQVFDPDADTFRLASSIAQQARQVALDRLIAAVPRL